MISRIEITATHLDARATTRKSKLLLNTQNEKIKNVFITDVYTIDKQVSQKDLEKIATSLSDPVTQKFDSHQTVIPAKAGIQKDGYRIGVRDDKISVGTTNKNLSHFSYAIEIGFLPGVTDNIAHTVQEIVEDVLKIKFENGEGIYSSQITFIDGELTQEEVEHIAKELYNPLIQRASIKSFTEFKKDGGMDIIVPKVQLTTAPHVLSVDIDTLDDEHLALLGKEGICYPNGLRKGPLALDLTFLKAIQAYFRKEKRDPTDIELESIAQTWSEHCKHTIFSDPIDDISNGLYATYIKKATELIRAKKGKEDFCASVFTDNSGAIIFDDDFLITHKVETHNSPSALDPFGGSITGIVGVNRDTIGFGLGAKPIANMYGFCLSNPFVDIPLYKGSHLTQKMLSSRRIMEGVIAGVNAGGNQSGIPTPQGFVYFDERYRGKPLVFVGTVGLIPRKIHTKIATIKKAQSGDYIVMVGGRVGKDGIHGATFSSEAMDSGSPATAVQIGDPITQKKLSDALVKEARDLLLYNSITDNGAGGLSCSIAEMAKESGGCMVTLEKVPLKYPGLEPWEIWISESQERMTLAVPKEKWQQFSSLMKRRGVEATVIGEFTNSGKCVVTYHNGTIMDIDMEFLHNGLPKRPMVTKSVTLPKRIMPLLKIRDHTQLLHGMIQRLTIASYEYISQQYDHIVQSSLVLPPLQGRGRVNADATIVRPILTSKKGVVLSQGLYPTYSESDPYTMAACTIDSAIRQAIAVGAPLEKIALLDNFCWCSPDDPQRLFQLKQAAKACFDTAVAYGTPFISGKDSMHNDFKGYDKKGDPIKISIPPTLLISSIGIMENCIKSVSLDGKFPGDLVYLLGDTREELGGSEYYGLLSQIEKREIIDHTIPKVNVEKNKRLYNAFTNCIYENLIASSVSLGRGGLGVALVKKSMGGLLGITISLEKLSEKIGDEVLLYSESQGRILVTVAPQRQKQFEQMMKGNVCALIGQVEEEPMILVRGKKGKTIIQSSVEDLLLSYRKPFKEYAL